MKNRAYVWYVASALVAGGAGFVVAPQPLIFVGLVATGILLWWLSTLDWFQRFYALTLVLMVGATSNIGPLVSISEYGRYAASGMLLVVALLTTRNKTPLAKSTLHKRVIGALWLLVAVAAASILWSAVPSQTALQVIALAILVSIIHLASGQRWTDRPVMVKDMTVGFDVLTLAFTASLAAAALGYPSVYSFGGSADTVGRFQGIFSNPNMLGLLAAIVIPLGWGIYLETRSILRFVLVLPAVAVVLLSESRTAILAASAALVWMLLRAGVSHVFKVGYLILIASIALLATGWNPLESSLSRFGKLEGGDVLNTRGDAWSSTIDLIWQQPIGYGWQAGRALFESLQGSADFTFTRTSVHNSYLQVLLELGILGLLPLLYLVAALLVLTTRGRMGGLDSGLVGVLTAGLIVQITESAIFGTGQPYPYVYWLAVGGALVAYKPREKENRRIKPHLPADYHQVVSQMDTASAGLRTTR